MTDATEPRAVVCLVGGKRVGLPVDRVREVCTDLEIVRMPGAEAPVEGVANVRGSVVTVLRAADLMGLPRGGRGPSAWLVVLRDRNGRVALGVDEVVDLDGSGTGVALLDVESQMAALFGAA